MCAQVVRQRLDVGVAERRTARRPSWCRRPCGCSRGSAFISATRYSSRCPARRGICSRPRKSATWQDPAMQLLRQHRALLHQRRVRLALRRRGLLRRVVARDGPDLRVLQSLHRGRHLRHLAHALAEQHQLVLHEELRLPGDRRRARRSPSCRRGRGRRRTAAGARLRLGERRENKKGGEPGPPPLAAQMHYFFGSARCS